MNDEQMAALKKIFTIEDIKVLMKPFVDRDEVEYLKVRGEVIEAKFTAAEAVLNPILDKPVTKESLAESIDEACSALMLMFLADVVKSALTGAAMPGGGTPKIMYGVEGEDGEVKLVEPFALAPGTDTKQ